MTEHTICQKLLTMTIGEFLQVLNIIENKFGHLEDDWFASEHIRKLPIFYFRFWNPSSSGIDAFSERWSDKQAFLCLRFV